MRVIHILAGLTGAEAFIALAYATHVAGGDPGPMTMGALAQLSAACAGLALAHRSGRFTLIAAAVLLLGANIFAGVIQMSTLVGDHPFRILAPVGGSLLILGWILAAFTKPNAT